jgi:hypothetical protein
MVIYLTNGNPIIAVVLMSLSTFKNESFVAAIGRISLSFDTEETADRFVKDVEPMGCHGSSNTSKDVVIFPDYNGSANAAKAIYHAVNCYKDCLTSINSFELYLGEEVVESLLKDIEQYIKKYFGEDAITIETRDLD